MNEEKKGFIAPVITPDQYIFGAGNVGLTVLQEDSNWGPTLPIEEIQNKGKFETYNCTAFGTTNAIELLMFKLIGERLNYSDRWVGIIAGTKEPGNDPHAVAEAIRKYGLIPEEMLPFSDDLNTVDEYYSFKGADKEACYRAGREWLAKYEFKHEWTFTPGQPVLEQLNNMKVALKGSPQCVALYSWIADAQGVYYSAGSPNHWTTIYNIDQFLEVFDSYDPFRKKADQSILYCKRYSISLKSGEEVKIGIMQQIINAMLKLIGLYKEQVAQLPTKPPVETPKPKPPTPAEKLYEMSKSLLGKRLTLDKSVPIHLGCAQAVSHVLKQAGYDIPKGGISGTYTLYEWLEDNFQELDEPEAGCVVISPTTHSVGHVGICGKYDFMYYKDYAIMSNDSSTGLYNTHWSLKRWEDYYEDKQKLKTYYFRPW